MAGVVHFDREHRSSRGGKNNVAVWSARRVRLRCGHETDSLPLVSTTVGQPDRYRCPEGCGIQPGRGLR